MDAGKSDGARVIYAQAKQVSRPLDRTVLHNPLLASVGDPAALDVLLSAPIPAGMEIEIELDQRTARL